MMAPYFFMGESMIDKILLGFTLFISFCNCCMMIYTFVRFLSAPHSSLMSRVVDLERQIAEINRENSEMAKAMRVITHSVLALIEFEMQYCLTEHKEMSDGLKKAKDYLHDYLSDR